MMAGIASYLVRNHSVNKTHNFLYVPSDLVTSLNISNWKLQIKPISAEFMPFVVFVTNEAEMASADSDSKQIFEDYR